jgi:hypothetical protein
MIDWVVRTFSMLSLDVHDPNLPLFIIIPATSANHLVGVHN